MLTKRFAVPAVLLSCGFYGQPAAAQPAFAPASLTVCGQTVQPQHELAAFSDAKITTRLWRDRISACGDNLIVDWWLYDNKHWSASLRRVVKNYTAARLPPVALNAQLSVGGKAVASPGGKVQGKLFEMEVAYVEAFRLAPALSVPALIAARKIPPINMFRPPVQRVFVDGHRDVKPYTSLQEGQEGPLARGMPMTGDRADLGLVTEWCASYISYFDIAGDYWWKACTDQALDTANVPWHVERSDGLPTLWDDPAFKGKGFDERNVAYGPNHVVLSPPASGWQLDDAHQPFAQLVPFMATRHPYFLWLAQYQAAALLGAPNCPVQYCERDTPQGPTLPMKTQIRGTAWSFRTLTQVVLMTPDAPPAWLWPKARFQDVLVRSDARWRAGLLKPTTDYWRALAENRGSNVAPPWGCAGLTKLTGRTSCSIQMWMYDYWGQGVGFGKWAGVTGLDETNRLMGDLMVYRYGAGSPYRQLGSPFTTIFSNPLVSGGPSANSRADVVRWSPQENLQYGTNKPLVVGSDGHIGQFTDSFWQVQGSAAFCAMNGDARCRDIAIYWQSEWERLRAANPSWLGGWEYGKFRIAIK